jgi:hypothetical protein
MGWTNSISLPPYICLVLLWIFRLCYAFSCLDESAARSLLLHYIILSCSSYLSGIYLYPLVHTATTLVSISHLLVSLYASSDA